MPSQINLNLYIPYFRIRKPIKGKAIESEVVVRSDREVNLDVLEYAIKKHFEKLGIKHDELVLVKRGQTGRSCTTKPRVTVTYSQLPRPRKMMITIRVPEAGFLLNCYQYAVKVFVKKGFTLNDPYEIFVRNYFIKIEYIDALRLMFDTNAIIRDWVIKRWRSVQMAESRHLLYEGHYERKANQYGTTLPHEY